MTENEIVLIENSWAKVGTISELAAELFYDKLFEINPGYRSLFKSDMFSQGQKLMAMLDLAVMRLRDLGSLEDALRDLGKRHISYGVKPEDYEPVGAALIWTLKQGLGNDFTEDIEDAWSKVYGLLSEVMVGARI